MKTTDRYDNWFSSNYDGLLRYANRYHKDGNDLLHFVYLRIRKLPHLDRVLDGKPWGYHILALYRQAKMSSFARMYRILDHAPVDVPNEEPDEIVFYREQMDLVVRQLPWFDRTLFELRMSGQSMVNLSKESGIPIGSIYYSLRKTHKEIKTHFDVCGE